MKAMLLEKIGEPLKLRDLPIPQPGPRQILIKVKACGVCRTDLHVYDGELPNPKLPLVLGHEIVGVVEALGCDVTEFSLGRRVGVPWLGGTCQQCRFCSSGAENLCEAAQFTGYQLDGGYAEYALAAASYCFPIPAGYSAIEAAPLLCAGLIGYRSLRLTSPARKLGLYGFGASAHIVAQIARYQDRQVFAFTRPGDRSTQEFARRLGVDWAGGSDELPPRQLDAAIIFAPVGALVPAALKAVRKGGTVVCAGIHMSEIPAFSYDLLWGERQIRSVANLTRLDGAEFFEIAPKAQVRTHVQAFRLEKAQEALEALRSGKLQGAAVLEVGSS